MIPLLLFLISLSASAQDICSQDKCLLEANWTSESTCEYIKCNSDACEGGGYLQWSRYVKCEHNTAIRVILIILAVIFMFFLFLVMTIAADDYFSPSIAGIVKHLRISESLAGVTFLAFGNGANDVFGSIASVSTGSKPKADLALGDLLGAGIFITTVVLSAIIITKSFRIAVLATIRDLVFFIIADILIAAWFIWFDHVQLWMPLTFLGLYAIYVITVILMRINSKRRKQKRNSESQIDQYKLSTLIGLLLDYMPILKHLQYPSKVSPEAILKDSGDSGDSEDDEGLEAEFHISHRQVFKSYDEASLAFSDPPEYPRSWKSSEILKDLWVHLRPYPIDFKDQSIISKTLSVLSVIPNLFLKITVPSNELNWSKPTLLLQCFCSIQWILFSLQLSSKTPIPGVPGLWLYGLLISLILSLIILITTPLGTEPRHYRQIYSYLGFIISITWILFLSSEIINVITMIGVITGISQEILGLTILAWSNCIGDVVADIAVVKQGFPKMAMAAAIGGPLFNLLIGFGIPFTIACIQGKQIELLISPAYRLLMLFLGISLITTLIAIFVQKFTVRWPHAMVLITIFIAFLVFIILSETHVLEWK